MRQSIYKVTLVAGSLILSILIMEFAVRVLDIPPRPLAPLPFHIYRISKNPVIGYELIPGYNTTDNPYNFWHAGYKINRDGFRDHDHEKTKPRGTFRIIALGDSTTIGNGIPNIDQTYTKILETMLNRDKNDNTTYEVLNMAVGGYHTMQEVETLRVKGLQYDPDLVFVTVCINDFYIYADGNIYNELLVKNKLSAQSTDFRLYSGLLKYSRLAFVLHHRIHYRLNPSRSDYDKWYTDNVLNGISPVEAGFTLLSELQQKHGFSVIIFILPDFRKPFNEYLFMESHSKVLQAAQGLPGITVIDLLESFADVDNNINIFSFKDGTHMNEYGHKIMAEILFAIIKNKNM
jgi:lysophospholipase L1-like esterase